MSETPNYKQYLNSSTWQSKRAIALAAAGYKCSKCGKQTLKGIGLHVHHRHYRTLGNEHAEDLQVLCKECHFGLHKELKKSRPSRKKGKGQKRLYKRPKERNCRWCKKEFLPSTYPRGGGIYCSKECHEAKKRAYPDGEPSTKSPAPLKKAPGYEYRGLIDQFPEPPTQ